MPTVQFRWMIFFLSLMPWIRFENLLELMIWWILKRLNSFRWYFVGNSQSSTKLPHFMKKKNRAHLFLRHLQTNALVFFWHFYFSATRNSVYNRLVHARNSFKHLVFMWARNKRLKSATFRIKRDPNSTWQIIKCTYWKHDSAWQSWSGMKHWLNIIRWGAIWKLSTMKHVRKRKCA